MANCALVKSDTNVVENMIVADPDTYTPPEGYFIVPIYWCDIGYTWVDANTGFVPTQGA